MQRFLPQSTASMSTAVHPTPTHTPDGSASGLSTSLPPIEFRSVAGGILTTASRTAAEYNGVTICIGRAATHGEAIQRRRRSMAAAPCSTGT